MGVVVWGDFVKLRFTVWFSGLFDFHENMAPISPDPMCRTVGSCVALSGNNTKKPRCSLVLDKAMAKDETSAKPRERPEQKEVKNRSHLKRAGSIAHWSLLKAFHHHRL